MMKVIRKFLILSALLSSAVLSAQDSSIKSGFDYQRLKPIVQVFGIAGYDLENNTYSYYFGRSHFGLQYQFNENWSAKIILDRGRPTTISDILIPDSAGNMQPVQFQIKEGAYYTIFLKFASLQWKVNDRLTLKGGAILQNHYITMERFWGLRYIAQTFQDLYWKIPSSDLGFMARYKLNDIVSFDVTLTNGEGPRIRQDQYGKVKVSGGIDINPSDKVQTRFFYHNRQSGVDGEATEQLFSAFAGYKPMTRFRVGGEFNYMNNLNYVSGLKSYGYSLYSAYRIIENTELFVRYDRLIYEENDTESIAVPGTGNTFMGGVSYSPVKGVNLSLNYQGWLPDDNDNSPRNNVLFSMEYKL
ncbi:MAG: hypothetical protein Kow00127_10400 [Bacteroidales bacterium]